MSTPQAAYVSAVSADGDYLIAVPLLTLEFTVPLAMVFLTEQVITVQHVPPADPVVTSTTQVPPLQVGQEVVVVFLNCDLNTAAIVGARPMEG